MLLLILLLSSQLSLIYTNEPVVQINDGTVKGVHSETINGKIFSAFTGIPFGEPPIGDLRFKAPVPVKSWNGTRDATNTSIVCSQALLNGQEDCLYLNVYTPKLFTGEDGPEKLAVMVFFHGGGFIAYTGNAEYYGPQLLLDKNIVLVTINYRLGILGFLSTGDEAAPGNFGLKDQTLALKWVRNNIKFFGGNPDKVTIFGESAGSASANLHLFSPASEGLFWAAILESGTIQNIRSFISRTDSLKVAEEVGNRLNCTGGSTQKLVDCLRQVDVDLLVNNEMVLITEWTGPISYGPVIEPKCDGAFITANPIDLMRSGEFTDVPIILGLNTQDGAASASNLYGDNLIEKLNANFDQVIPIALMYDRTTSGNTTQMITDKIRKFYFDDQPVDAGNVTALMFTDGMFLDAIDQTARLYKNHAKSPTFLYLFGYKGSHSLSTLTDPSRDYGVSHLDELLYLFTMDAVFPNTTRTDDDGKMIDFLTTLWTNFATTRDPTRNSDEILDKWSPVKSDNLEYYHIDVTGSETKSGLYMDRAVFWRNLPTRPDKAG